MVPVSGSAYTYAYASLGELVAWIIGWDLIIEYAVGNIGVAIGWSGHFRELLSYMGIHSRPGSRPTFRSATDAANALATARRRHTPVPGVGAHDGATIFGVPVVANLPRSSRGGGDDRAADRRAGDRPTPTTRWCCSRSGSSCSFVAVGVFLIKPRTGTIRPGRLCAQRVRGISAGAAIIFFSYIGFDAVSTAAEEAKDPAKDMPFGIIMSSWCARCCTSCFPRDDGDGAVEDLGPPSRCSPR
jgi:APA family basic amino acid/polyamine antiporter